MHIYQTVELDSIFIELINTQNSNKITIAFDRYSNMDLDELNHSYFKPLLDKTSKENKSVCLLGEFNLDPLKFDNHTPTNEFFDCLSSHMFLPHITQSARVSSNSTPLIDNISSNILGLDYVLANITTAIFDPLSQLTIASSIFFSNSHPSMSNIYETDWANFDQ